MTSTPDNPKQQFLFFFDNKLVEGQPGGKALIAGFHELVGPLLGSAGHSAGDARLFAPDTFSAPDTTTGSGGRGGNKAEGGNGHEAAGIELAAGLLDGFSRGDLDL